MEIGKLNIQNKLLPALYLKIKYKFTSLKTMLLYALAFISFATGAWFFSTTNQG